MVFTAKQINCQIGAAAFVLNCFRSSNNPTSKLFCTFCLQLLSVYPNQCEIIEFDDHGNELLQWLWSAATSNFTLLFHIAKIEFILKTCLETPVPYLLPIFRRLSMTRMRVFVINPNMIIIVLIHLATFFTGLSSKVVVIFRVTVVEPLLLSAAMLNECLTAGCESYPCCLSILSGSFRQ